MNFFVKLGAWVKKAFGVTEKWYVRLGMGQFFDQHLVTAVKVVGDLMAVKNNAAFGEWEKEAWEAFQAATGEVKGKWITIIINIAAELLGAKALPASQKETL